MKPSDYATFAFRLISHSKRDELFRKVEAVRVHLNDRLPDGERRRRKNDVIVEALELGLKALARK